MAFVTFEKAKGILESKMMEVFDELKISYGRLNPTTPEEKIAGANCATKECMRQQHNDKLILDRFDTLIVTALSHSDNGDLLFTDEELDNAFSFARSEYMVLKNYCSLPSGRKDEGKFFSCLSDYLDKMAK